MGAVLLTMVLIFFIFNVNSNDRSTLSLSKKTMELQDRNKTIRLYFMSQDRSKLVEEDMVITENNEKDIIKQVLVALKKGPQTPGFIATIPKDIEFIQAHFDKDEHMIELNISANYAQLKTSEEVFLRASIVKTLTSLPFVDKVQLTIAGESLLGTDGNPLGPISSDDIILDKRNPLNTEYVEVQLYFSNEDATALKLEKRTIAINPNEPLEKYVLEQLISGPTQKELNKTIPVETKIKGVQTNDGICYVDFSNEFRSKHWGGSTGELYTIYSIVNSLTELPHIQKVQFLIEGEKQETFKGHVEFSHPFERNLDLIQQ